MKNEAAWICFSVRKRQPSWKFIPFHSSKCSNCDLLMQQLKRRSSLLCFQRYGFIFIQQIKLLVLKTSWMLREKNKWNQKLLTLGHNTTVQWKRSPISSHQCWLRSYSFQGISKINTTCCCPSQTHDLYFKSHYFKICNLPVRRKAFVAIFTKKQSRSNHTSFRNTRHLQVNIFFK